MVSTFASLSLQISFSSITPLKRSTTIFVLVGKHPIYMPAFHVFVWFPCEQSFKIIYNDCEGGHFEGKNPQKYCRNNMCPNQHWVNNVPRNRNNNKTRTNSNIMDRYCQKTLPSYFFLSDDKNKTSYKTQRSSVTQRIHLGYKTSSVLTWKHYFTLINKQWLLFFSMYKSSYSFHFTEQA